MPGEFIRRGLTVAAFNLLEAFFEKRLGEIAGYINQGSLNFSDLPQKLRLGATKNVIEVAAARARRLPAVELEDLAHHIGESLTSVHGGAVLSPLTWMWKGSNLSADDFANTLRLFHVHDAFSTVRSTSVKLGFNARDPNNNLLDLNTALKFLANERHSSAHDSSHQISVMWLNTVGNEITRYASSFDVLVSIAAVALRKGTDEFIRNEKWTTHERARFEFVRERKNDFAHISDGKTKAASVNKSGTDLFDSVGRDRTDYTVVAQTDISGRLTNWKVPAVG